MLNSLERACTKAATRVFAVAFACVVLLAVNLTPALASTASPAVDMIMSLGDGGSPFVAQKDASSTSTPSGTWTVTVRNTGTSASSGTTTIQLQAGATGYFLPSAGQGWSCTDTGDRVRTCTNDAAVPAGGSLPPLTFPWASLPGYGYAYAQAILTNPSDGTINNNTISIQTPVVENPAVNLSMSLGDGGSPFVAQKDASSTSTPSGTWTVTVRNTGTSASSGTTTIQLQAGATGYFLPSAGQGWSCTDTGDRVRTCTNDAAVPAGGSLPPLTFPWASLPGYGYAYAQAILTNPSDGTINNNTISIQTPVVENPAVNLSMSLGDGGSPFVAQKDASSTSTPSGTWTVTVRNTGTSASSGTTTIQLQAGATGYFLPSAGQGWSCTDTGDRVRTCTNDAAVPAGGSLPPLTFPWASLPGYGYAYAQAILTNPSDGTINNNTISIQTPVVEPTSSIDVVATMSDGGAPFTAGKQAGYTVQVRNVGTSAATGDVTVHYPVPFAGVQATGSGWTCTDSTVSDPTCTHPGGVAAGSSLPPVGITGTVPVQNAPGTVRAQVDVDNASDAFTNDNFAHLDTSVTPVPIDVVATVSDGGAPFTAGKQAGYTVQVRNVGTSAATGDVTVHYPVPFAGVQATGSGWTCTDSTVSDPTCTHPGGVAAGSSLPPVGITGTVPVQNAPGTVRAQVDVDNASDAFTNDNFAHLDTSVTPVPIDVVATVSDGGAPFTAGKQAGYTVQVRNVGTSAATGDVTVHYPVPFAGVQATGSGWTCTDSTVSDPTCTHPGGVAAGSSLPPVGITGTVPVQNAPGTVRAQVDVDNASDAFTNDNHASLDTGVTTVIYSGYVAMGDSYSAGEGLAPYLDKSGCDRSNQAYGPELDSALSLGTLTFVACTGAVTQDFFAPNHNHPSEPAQIRRLKITTTSVTFTIGGNDVGFANVLDKCVHGVALFRWKGYGCSKDKTLVSQVNSRIAALHGSGTAITPDGTSVIPIQTLLLRIHQLAPQASIAVAGYPALFGSSSSTYTKSNSAPSKYVCKVSSGGSIDYQDARWLNSEEVSLDNAISSAVATAQARGVPVRYVDAVPKDFATHGLCDSATAWVNGLSVSGLHAWPGSFHPSATGQSSGYEAAFSGLPSF